MKTSLRQIVNQAFILLLFTFTLTAIVSGQSPDRLKLKFVDYFFENGSPVNWKTEGDTLLRISLLPDHERESLNRQTDHWYFRLLADSGSRVRLIISKMQPDIYNGIPASDWWNYSHDISCYISYDRKSWIPVKTSRVPDHGLLIDILMERNYVYVARLPPYTISDLESLKARYAGNALFEVLNIGATIEKRPLEILRIGDPKAPYSVVIRARAHPWEPGGNWVIEGLINKFISENQAKWKETFCVYIMPMANKDGVARGMTRFNVAGMDLNRKWEKLSDSLLCPEKYALEKFLEELIKKGIKPSLGIDIHNDDAGSISLASHYKDDTIFINKMKCFEKLMREHTSFSEEVRYSWITPGRQDPFVLFENGLYRRFGIEAIVYELNANWIGSPGKVPAQDDWIKVGENLNEVFYEYFERTGKQIPGG